MAIELQDVFRQEVKGFLEKFEINKDVEIGLVYKGGMSFDIIVSKSLETLSKEEKA